uniref:Protein bric-a-brac 1 n=2 Tax=Cacopsylla melanoneura TaxID=428564 RepID=A0A8D8PZZ3_9HEMI
MQPSDPNSNVSTRNTGGQQHGGGGTPQQFCLRWNNYQSNLTNVFDQLLQSESFVDVTLACDGNSLKAHKMVLSACSPYFQNVLSENPCQHPIIILKDIRWFELKAVVEFMYKGEINVCQEDIAPLLQVAESLKIRGLADVNNEHDLTPAKPNEKTMDDTSIIPSSNRPNTHGPSAKKRRRLSIERCSPEDARSACSESPNRALELVTSPPNSQSHHFHPPPPPAPLPPSQQQGSQGQGNMVPLPLPPPLPAASSIVDDLEIKPGIAEMIREEERAKMLESSNAWLGASTSNIAAADSYQYQLQSMWQKCWNTNQSLVHNLRFRERGPLKSWRPETMAEAILSVLKEGLSLSQAARKYDIPYPTFVLYANRVHNMLGPSADGSSDLRPKGRGRPQRILLGYWPEEHIQNVIRAVVFRDPQNIKDEPLAFGYPRISCLQDLYGPAGACLNGPDAPMSPNSAAAAAVVAVAQGLRQQMLAAAHNSDPTLSLLANHLGQNGGQNNGPNNLLFNTPIQSPEDSRSPPTSPLVSNNNLEVGIGVTDMSYKPNDYSKSGSGNPNTMFDDDIEDLVKAAPSRPSSAARPPSKDQPIPLVIDSRTE